MQWLSAGRLACSRIHEASIAAACSHRLRLRHDDPRPGHAAFCLDSIRYASSGLNFTDGAII